MSHTVLVVEDNPVTLKMVRITLESGGYRALTASNAAETLHVVRTERPDLVLMDLVLPDMDGFRLIEELRMLPGGNSLTILAFTGLVSKSDDARLVAAGFNGLLVKPLEPSRIIAAVGEYLGRADVTSKPRSRHRVLVVDDDATVLRATRQHLEREGFAVSTAASAKAALSTLRRRPADVVLSDVLMPGMDGFELTAALRHDRRTAGIPVVLSSPFFLGVEDRKLATMVGAQQLIERTPNQEGAAAALRAALAEGVPRRAGAASQRALREDYQFRMVSQLEQQVAQNRGMTQQVELQAAALKVLGPIAEALSAGGDLDRTLDTVLAQCIDAAGLSRGAILLRNANGAYRCISQYGFSPGAQEIVAMFAPGHLFAALGREPRLIVPARRASEGDAEADELLARAGASSALIAPIGADDAPAGALLLTSSTRLLVGEEWQSFAKAIALQLSQALALADAFRSLGESERRFRSLFEGVPIGLLQTTAEGEPIDFNPALVEKLGAPDKASAMKMNIRERYQNPEDREAFISQLRKLGTVRGFQTAMRRWDGTEIRVEINASLVKTPQGASVIEGSIMDVTERWRAEQALRDSELRLRTLFETVNLIVLGLDERATVNYVNPFFYQLTGFSPADVQGKEWFQFLPPGDRPGLREAFNTLLHGEAHAHFENAILTRGGEPRIVAWHNTVVHDAEGRATGTLSIGEDITDRRRAEATLRESEERFRQLTENLREVFFLTEPRTGLALYVSPAYREIWGRATESALAAPYAWLEGIHPEDRASVLAAAQSIEPGGMVNTFRVVRPDGTVRWIRSRIFPVVNTAGELYRLAGVAEDVTQLRQTEQQLLQAQKMEAVGQLAGGVAHDLNNLLAAISVFSELASDALPAESPSRDDLSQVTEAVKRANTLTRQLLLFSKQQVVQVTTLDPNSVITNLTKMLSRLIGEDVELVTQLAPDAGLVKADAGQLEQVIVNLAVNARDAMPRGGRLTIATGATQMGTDQAAAIGLERPGAHLTITVSDTGEGMSPEVRARIFEPFFTTKGAKGTGLGLATVYAIMRQSGGAIEVTSTPGEGTTFTLHLPQTEAASPGLPAAPAQKPSLRGTETILVIEDDPGVRQAASEVLRRLGYTVLLAKSGAEALSQSEWHAGPIHLVVSDVVMPGLSGTEAVEQLRQNRPGLRALFMSGYVGDAVARRGVLEAGPFLQKPFTAQSLAEKVREVLASAGPGA